MSLLSFGTGVCLIVAHRGGRGGAPENTLEGCDWALNQGAQALEIDVQLSADGELIAIHDPTVNRTTNGTGHVRDLSVDTLQSLDAGYHWQGDDGAHPYRDKGIRLPTLREMLHRYPDTPLIVELKGGAGPAIANAMSHLIADTERTDRLVVSSFSVGILRRFRALRPRIPTNMAMTETASFYARHWVGLHAAWAPPGQVFQVPHWYGPIQVVQQRFVEAAHACQMPVQVWTVNKRAEMDTLLSCGVDALITDYPRRARRAAAQAGRLPS
jgi:glycerophosphoryl diester phosphodiesterase